MGDERDLFDLTFQILNASLRFVRSPSDASPADPLRDALFRAAEARLEQDARRRVSVAHEYAARLGERYESLRHLQQTASLQVERCVRCSLSAGQQHRGAVGHRLRVQEHASERRLQDLVFEVVGEYSKALLRAVRREEFLVNASRTEIVARTWQTLWEQFAARLQLELLRGREVDGRSRLSVAPLSPKTHAPEIAHILKRAHKKLGLVSQQRYVVLSVLRVTKNDLRPTDKDKARDKASSLSQQPLRLAHYRKDLSLFFKDLQDWIHAAKIQAEESKRKIRGEKVRWTSLLSNACCAWQLHTLGSSAMWDSLADSLSSSPAASSQCNPHILRLARRMETQFNTRCFNRRVYVCLEERSLMASESPECFEDDNGRSEAHSLLIALQEIYCDFPHTASTLRSSSVRSRDNADLMLAELQHLLCTHPLRVERIETRHQRAKIEKFSLSQRNNPWLLEELSCFPDILRVHSLRDNTILHFAPAPLLALDEALQSSQEDKCALTLFLSALTGQSDAIPLLRTDEERHQSNLCDAMTTSEAKTKGLLPPQGSLPKENADDCVLMCPLTPAAFNSLAERYFPERFEPENWPCIHVLPDDPRRIGSHCTHSAVHRGSSSNDRLQCAYAFLSDENSLSSSSNDQNGQRPLRSAFYLVQLRPVSSDYSCTLLPPPLSGRSMTSRHDVANESTAYDEETFKSFHPETTGLPSSRNNSPEDSETFANCFSSYFSSHVQVEPFIGGETTERAVVDTALSSSGSTIDRTAIPDSDKDNGGVVLSRICLWRSCNCDVVADCNLCRYHTEMKIFLDSRVNRTGGTLESSKYLPRKILSFNTSNQIEQKKDLMIIRAGSSLLQELWDGRLKSTVKLFSKKITGDMHFRSFYEAQIPVFLKYHGTAIAKHSRKRQTNELLSSMISIPPTWILWRNQEYFIKTFNDQKLSLELLQYILASEQLISKEIDGFMKLQYFPGQELNQIRKEVKRFKDQQEHMLSTAQLANDQEEASTDKTGRKLLKNGSSTADKSLPLRNGYDNLVSILQEETQLCERKLDILSQRRQTEDEGRLHLLRKLAKMKSIKEEQSRDPTNFRNQGGRF